MKETMKTTYDKSADALYVYIKSGEIDKTIERGLVLVDVDKKGDLLGVEVLNYSKLGKDEIQESLRITSAPNEA